MNSHDRHTAFALLIDSVVEYAFVTLDLNNRITGWNRGAERMLGYTEAEILSQSAAIIFTPQDRAAGVVEQELETARRTGSASDERWHMRKDGTTFWCSGVMTLLRDNGGRVCGYGKVMRDLTEQKRAGEALRRSEESLRLFMNNVTDQALFLLDAEGRVASWNAGAERLFGYKTEEIVGRPAHLVAAPFADAAYARRELIRASTEASTEDESWLTRRDGALFYARWVTYRITDEKGKLLGFAKVLRDETARRRIDEQQRRDHELVRAGLGAELDCAKEDLRALSERLMTTQEEERRRIARELHDDVAQRLAVLQNGMSQLAPALPQRLAADFNRLQSDVSSIGKLVRSVSHRLHPSVLEDLGLVAALRSLAEEFEGSNALALRLVIASPPPELPIGVATAVYRIAQEALRNVARHAPEARTTVTLSHDDSTLHLRIDDDGPGFRPGDVAAAGRGLGLISMQERARLVNGAVAVHSTPGAGTHIELRIPLPPRAGSA